MSPSTLRTISTAFRIAAHRGGEIALENVRDGAPARKYWWIAVDEVATKPPFDDCPVCSKLLLNGLCDLKVYSQPPNSHRNYYSENFAGPDRTVFGLSRGRCPSIAATCRGVSTSSREQTGPEAGETNIV